ncbi:hypothetical protein I3842_15G139800 [Carya illinoinensis]|uniref:CCHC-type domain-containing protein n=1 Tax=Carya illinoinensis TaxID=32201 RepID=A0A922A6W3_CARIL|nr:hypothetical protein I3842_15G139800 [Carya illinoinensis]
MYYPHVIKQNLKKSHGQSVCFVLCSRQRSVIVKDLHLHPVMERDACFNCHQRGHWAKNCPFKTPDKKFEPSSAIVSLPSSSSSNDSDLPLIRCRCGQDYCLVRTSRTDKNPGRKFYTCPGVNGSKCGFFKWCDEAKNGESSKSPQSVYPLCSCGAGVCRRNTWQVGPNAGRSYFVCPIKKGHGACLFHQWEGTQDVITINDLEEECKLDVFAKSTSKNLTGGLGDLSIEHSERIKFESPEMGNPQQQSPSFVALDGHFENEQEPLIESGGHDKTLDFSNPAKYIDPSHVEASSTLHDLVLLGAELSDPIVKKTLLMSHATAWAEIYCQETQFWMQITSARDKSTQGQILGHHVLGWWGRLAFLPSRCLSVPPTRPFFCCVFPSFDPTFVQNKNVFNNEGFTDLPHSLSSADFDKPSSQISGGDTTAVSNVSWELSNPKSSSPIFEGSTTTSHLEVLEQTLVYVQNQLITSLQSMDPLKHESMTQAAKATFDVLDRLSVDYTPFRECVRKFIDLASSLADMEHPATNEHSLQELIEQYHCEKVRYEDICHFHAKTVSSLMASSQRILSLREEVSYVKDLLMRVENQLSGCEAETKVLETRAGEICKDMLGSQKSLQTLSEAMELCLRREQEQNAAKAALEMARLELGMRLCLTSM